MLRLPFFAELEPARRVLLAGIGGGFDVFCGLPLFFALRDAGKDVRLANLTFTNLYGATGRTPAPAVLEVTADSGGSQGYFPERYLCEHLRGLGDEIAVYCLHRTGVGPLREAYEAIVAEYRPDTLLLVDGGTDSLMRGDETGLGTPHEDMASIAAMIDLEVPRKLLACIAFGVDAYHGVCHAQFLEAVADLTRRGGYLGCFSLTDDMPEVMRYRAATESVFARMPRDPSIVNSSMLSALAGQFGDHHVTDRTAGSRLFINPLMPIYWTFRLGPVAERVLYLDALKTTQSWSDLLRVVAGFRASIGTPRPWDDIPV